MTGPSAAATGSTAGPAMAALTGVPIGFLAGLIGLGGGEFRLPLLVLLFRMGAREAVPLNLLISLVTLSGALAARAVTLSLAPIAALGPAVLGLVAGSMAGAYVAPGLLRRLSDRHFERLLAVLLLAIAAILMAEAFLPLVPGMLVDPTGAPAFATGVPLGLGVGVVASALGVAGGELLIPTLILVYGAGAAAAGTASLAISLPTVTAGLVRYGRLRQLPGRARLLAIALPMGLGSLAGAGLGALLVLHAPDSLLKAILAVVLVAAAAKAFLRRGH